ncbi:hypothetical protein MHU86_14662 [Fragilaria crotonensis]|nr:hypothetical protein MHU86_14662 [Fragilaria crotonensis]
MKTSLTLLLSTIFVGETVVAFTSPMFQTIPSQQIKAPSVQEGVEIELPDFDELFKRIQSVSPLAKIAIEQAGKPQDGVSHFDSVTDVLKWSTVESKPKNTVHQVDKIENFQNLGCPVLRLRSTMSGPCVGLVFANLIMNLSEREKWDPSIRQVYEAYPIQDLDVANVLMGFGKYGDCSRLGVGYCQTKSYLAVPGREQLTLCGIQDFPDKSCVIWGTEMEEWHNHLLPADQKRLPRSKTHLFSVTMVPTGSDSFDVEYVLQIDVGGLPNWLTTPILIETIKGMFHHGQNFFSKNQDEFLKAMEGVDTMMEREGILMTP